jgi:hypothetical protein
MDVTDKKITQLPIRAKDSSKVLTLVKPFDGCQHLRATVDEKLAELKCTDCGEKLNPISFLVRMAKEETSWGWQKSELAKARAELAARKRCRCTKCGAWTDIRRVGNREVVRLKQSDARPESK